MNKAIKYSIDNYSSNTIDEVIDTLSMELEGVAGASAGVKAVYSSNKTSPITLKGTNFINADGSVADPPREHAYGEPKVAPDKNGVINLPNKWYINYFMSYGAPKFKGDLKVFRNLENLGTIALQGQNITGDIACLSKLNKLTTLILKDNLDITGDIAVIDNMPNLNRLTLEETNVYGDVKHITDKGIDLENCLYGNRIYGCLSDASANCVYTTGVNNSSDFTWKQNGRSGTDKKALVLSYIGFKTAQDAINYLIDTASNTPQVDNKCTGVRSRIELFVREEKFPSAGYILPMNPALISAMKTILSWKNYSEENFKIKVQLNEYSIVGEKLTWTNQEGRTVVLE